ncbi:transcriptional regulator (plasmid) [Enterococcus mundtii QU 25]|uniref:helix-turn-helix domain-containing protein n=1 Tax=Enterococcus mundtii TaxID=53346 RepID=UPI0003C55545|nr:helix-turn-helix domain-containing protein [Enterococcus mundtii]BAO08472.1 transcriptional regulator [Enterococcus mundtii QU 25]
MSQLFYHMIYQEKTKRWFTILAQLEESQTVTAKDLADKLSCTPRTIHADIKKIKNYFGTLIILLGDGEGYHFSFQNPLAYTRKKQALLDQEPLFFFADQLFAGIHQTNHQWADCFSLSIASFGRIKRVFVQLLKETYRLSLVEKDNRLRGEETAIRQFMYDLYFTLPMYPKVLERRIESWGSFNQLKETGNWVLDPLHLTQWRQLAQWRIDQGQCLQPKEGSEETQEQLVRALNETITLSFPPQEKAALFLLSLNENQFLHPARQKEFVRQFSSDWKQLSSTLDFEDVSVHFFETLTHLVNLCFQLPPHKPEAQRKEDVSEERLVLNQLLRSYYESKKRFERSLVLTFHLTGSPVLQEWIKKKVRQQLQTTGYYLIEGIQPPRGTRQVTITNTRMPQTTAPVVKLSTIPEESEIRRTLKQIEG